MNEINSSLLQSNSTLSTSSTLSLTPTLTDISDLSTSSSNLLLSEGEVAVVERIVSRSTNSSEETLIENITSIRAVKSGEIGWSSVEGNDLNSNDRLEEAPNSTRTILPISSPPIADPSIGINEINPLKYLTKFPPAMRKIFSLIFSLLILIVTIVVLYIVLTSNIGGLDQDDNDDDEINNGNSTISTNSNSNGTNSTSTSTSTSSPISNSSPTKTISTSSITLVIIIFCLIVEIIYVYSRISTVYGFFRRKKLLVELSYITDLESIRSNNNNNNSSSINNSTNTYHNEGIELEEIPEEEEEESHTVGNRRTSSPQRRTTTLRQRTYTPTGFRKYFELALNLPPSSLLPSPSPSSPPPSQRSSTTTTRRRRNRTTEPEISEEEASITRAHKIGSAPMYGSEEMRGSKMLMKSNSLRRWSWGIFGVATASDSTVGDEEEGSRVEMSEGADRNRRSRRVDESV